MKETTDSNQFLIRVTAEAFKNVKVLDFMPNRFVTKISGANGAGKTSALDAIFQGLAPRKTLSPAFIRQGEKKGFLRIETNTHIITRKLDDKGGGLQIEAKASGTLIKAPDDWLEGIAGDLGFDPLRFMRMKPEEQFEVLKSLVELEADIDDLTIRNENDAETITRKKAEAKRLEATRDHMTVDKSLPTEPVDIKALLAAAATITEHNREVEKLQRQRQDEDRTQEAHRETLAAMQEKHDRMKAELLDYQREMETSQKAYDSRAERLAAREPLPTPQNRTQLDERISSASENNQAITINNSRREQRESLDRQVDNLKDELTKLEETVRERKVTIARTLEKAKFPVPGLSFETIEEGSSGRERKNPKKIVTYHGIPLADASSAEQIRVSTAIGMAGKPDLRFLLIREGSLLDDSNMMVLEQMAHEHGYQILMEVVDTSGKVGIFMEDGAIKTVNPEPEPAAAKKATRKGRNEKQGELIK